MELLTKEQIKAAQDVRSELVPVPLWGGTVRVQTTTVGKLQACRAVLNAEGQSGERTTDDAMEERLFVLCVVEPAFTLDDLPWLREKSAEAFRTVMNAIYRVLRADKEAMADAERSFRDRPGEAVAVHAGAGEGTPAAV